MTRHSGESELAYVQVDSKGEPLDPNRLRHRGLKRADAALRLLGTASVLAERVGRLALHDLVDAFLHDREKNQDLFVKAHEVGRALSETVECEWKAGPDEYRLECPIYALHELWAYSVAMTVTTECSICGSGALACDHIPGEMYDGEMCTSLATGMGGLGHVAMTTNPDFIYTWHQPKVVATTRLLADGTIQTAGQPAYCTHCQECEGAPDEGDLDPEARFRARMKRGLSSQSP